MMTKSNSDNVDDNGNYDISENDNINNNDTK